MRFLQRFLRLLCSFIIFLLLFFCYSKERRNESIIIVESDETKTNGNIIMWWSPIEGDLEHYRQCGDVKCFFTEKRSHFDDPMLKAFLFYGSSINITDIPLPRRDDQIWGLFHEESPKNHQFILYEEAISLFNITSTFSRYSDIPMTLQYLKDVEELTSDEFYQTIKEKNQLQTSDDLAPILYIQSICDTMSRRDDYVKELGKYIRIDSYGGCLNNRTLPQRLSEDYLSTIETEEFYKFIGRYKFVISYENGVCIDYISEKLWRPLSIGIVPIYFGSPTIRDWLPNERSAILIADFDSPQKLAKHINYLNSNDLVYSTYLEHKLNRLNPISNHFLLEKLKEKSNAYEFMEEFECYVCRFVSTGKRTHLIATEKHYDCDKTLPYPKMMMMTNNVGGGDDYHWRDFIVQGKCEAKVLSDFVMKNVKYSQKEFEDELNKRMLNI